MPETKPRYTVELTTEGWQIKDNGRGTIGADAFATSEFAGLEADRLTNLDACRRVPKRDR